MKYLQERLDYFGDDWRNATIETDVKPDVKDVKPVIPATQTQSTSIKTEKSKICYISYKKTRLKLFFF